MSKSTVLAPHEMRHIINKCLEAGNDQVILCERGSAFGYNNLVVDMLGFDTMKSMNVPVFLMLRTHFKSRVLVVTVQVADAIRLPPCSCGYGDRLGGFILEAHPDPDKAKCDGPSALRLNQLEPFLIQIKQLDDLVKGFETLDTQ